MKNMMIVVMVVVMSWTNGCSSCDKGFSVYAGHKDVSANIQPCAVVPVDEPMCVRISGSMNPETKFAVIQSLRSKGWVVSEGFASFGLKLQKTRRGNKIRYIAYLYQQKRILSIGAGESTDWSRNFSVSGRYMSNRVQVERADAEIKAAVQAIASLKY